jgi:hypothetical protein
VHGKRYLYVFIGIFIAAIAVILALNLALGERGLGSAEAVRQASTWQQTTRGVTYAPPIIRTRAFKAHRLADRAAEINAMVLGASSLMGITEAMFPAPMLLYNFALPANPTSAIAAEAEFIEQHHANRIRTVLIGLDWAIGMIYRTDGVQTLNLAPAATLVNYGAGTVPLHQKFADALSSPKVISLGNALRAVVKSGQPAASFRHTFFDLAGTEYRCADGLPARDYDVVNRGTCLGYRYDGSWTFAGERHLGEARAQLLERAAAAPSSKFSKYLCETQGEPNPEYLRRLGAFAQRFTGNGGTAIFILPPLIPGMEQEMLKVPGANRCLARTKSVLDGWARQHGITVIDAAASEHFGCKPEEFLDENHAWPECHARILGRYWADKKQQRVASGLYRPGL